jgi:hypothetical protein
VLAGAILVALLSCRPFAGGWNDGSRLATVESLVDYHTFSIDRSIFVVVPTEIPPYPPDDLLLRRGTQDKLLIAGRYYSDKSPVPALWLAAVYQTLQWSIGLVAREQPSLFCYLMNLTSSGLAYVLAVLCMHRLGREIGLSLQRGLLLTASFALCTIGLVYAQHVNNHILLLAVAAAMLVTQARWCSRGLSAWLIAQLGLLAGLGYTIDLGAGPVLVGCTTALVAWRTRSWKQVVVCVLAMAPWMLLHHSVNYAIAGTLKPANAVAEYLAWPSSPFSAENMTGNWHHESVFGYFRYLFLMLFGKQGFVGHNLALFLALPATVMLLRSRSRMTSEIMFCTAWSVGTVLLYAATSSNYSGVCCSIRWFVPLLAPLYFVVAVVLKERPGYAVDLLLLSIGGLAMCMLGCVNGPWSSRMIPGYWFIQVVTLAAWGIFRWRVWRMARAHAEASPKQRAAA